MAKQKKSKEKTKIKGSLKDILLLTVGKKPKKSVSISTVKS